MVILARVGKFQVFRESDAGRKVKSQQAVAGGDRIPVRSLGQDSTRSPEQQCLAHVAEKGYTQGSCKLALARFGSPIMKLPDRHPLEGMDTFRGWDRLQYSETRTRMLSEKNRLRSLAEVER